MKLTKEMLTEMVKEVIQEQMEDPDVYADKAIKALENLDLRAFQEYAYNMGIGDNPWKSAGYLKLKEYIETHFPRQSKKLLKMAYDEMKVKWNSQ